MGTDPGTGMERERGRSSEIDDHRLYQGAVQCVDVDLDFAESAYRTANGKRLTSIREDFCGTALLSCEWARRGAPRRAIGVDLHQSTLAWARKHNLPPIGAAAERVELIRDDVRTVRCAKVDAILALNFSYWIFRTRAELRGYLEAARGGLARDGIVVLDAFGGKDSMGTGRDRRPIAAQTLPDGTRLPRFTYIWDQAYFNPVDHRFRCHIDFEMQDGTRRDRAFSYDWRFWTLPELTETLLEAGFARAEVFTDGWDAKNGEGDGRYQRRVRFAHDPVWLAYVVGYMQT